MKFGMSEVQQPTCFLAIIARYFDYEISHKWSLNIQLFECFKRSIIMHVHNAVSLLDNTVYFRLQSACTNQRQLPSCIYFRFHYQHTDLLVYFSCSVYQMTVFGQIFHSGPPYTLQPWYVLFHFAISSPYCYNMAARWVNSQNPNMIWQISFLDHFC